MKRCFLFLAVLLLTQWKAFAQQTSPAANEAEKTRQAQAAAQQRLAGQAPLSDGEKGQEQLREFLNSQSANRKLEPGPAADLEAKFLEFRLAIPKFREATEEYGQVLSMNGKLDKNLKNIETQADILLRYLSAAKVNHPRPDAQEFKDYSASELQWETLNAAEHISAFLPLAVAVERRNVVSAETLEFLYTLDGQLLRLKWLTSHTK